MTQAALSSGDTGWVLVSSALVLLMTVGLAFFYGRLVRPKNALNTMMMSVVALGAISVQWVLVGYSIAFAHGSPWWGGLSWLGFKGVGPDPDPAYAATIPLQAHAMFQAMFAIITPALISGAIVERMHFRAYVVFILLWATFVYDPLAHWVWGAGGWLQKLGALDFAGGTVVHISAGVSALVAARMLGPRKDFKRAPIVPHNVPLVLLGAGLLWFGWFGFNAGSALAANGLAALAFPNTNTAAAAALVPWVCPGGARGRRDRRAGHRADHDVREPHARGEGGREGAAERARFERARRGSLLRGARCHARAGPVARRRCDRLGSTGESRSGLARPAADERILEEQVLDPRPEERVERLARRVDDGLSLDVEARVQHHLPPRGLADGLQQGVKFRIVPGGHRLHAGGAVDVGDGGQGMPELRAHVHGHDHERQLGSGRHLEPAIHFLEPDGGSEQAERLAHLHHGVDAIPHVGVARVGEDAAVSEGARPELHAAAIPGDHPSRRNETRRLRTRLGPGRETRHLDTVAVRGDRRVDRLSAIARPEERNLAPPVPPLAQPSSSPSGRPHG